MLDELRARYRDAVARDIGRIATQDDRARQECNERFASQRLDEGIEIATYLHREYGDAPITALDIGAGNGGVTLGLAAARSSARVIAVDVVPNPTLLELRRSTRLPVAQVLATADRLPFRGEAVDVVLCLDTIEHLPEPRASGEEMMRVLRRGGQVMLTTPPRLRYLLRRDPHFAIAGLLLLPDRLQRVVAERRLPKGVYDVVHIFWSAGGIVRLFPRRGRTEVMINTPWPPPPRRGAQWLQWLRHHAFKRLRHILWDRIAIYKA